MPRHNHTKDKIDAITYDSINEYVQSVDNLKAVFTHIGVKSFRSPTYEYLRKRLTELGVRHDHIGRGHEWISTNGPKMLERARLHGKIPNEVMFSENSPIDRGTIKNRILKEQLISYVCSMCGNSGIWLEKALTLTLDHINGINNDHRLENLRFLCPNCDSQTPTYGSKNIKYQKG
jgi:5-methylcytosine-specific restriction endonuclease McrA